MPLVRIFVERAGNEQSNLSSKGGSWGRYEKYFEMTKLARLIADIFLQVDRELHMLFPTLKSQTSKPAEHQKEVVTRAVVYLQSSSWNLNRAPDPLLSRMKQE